MKAENALAKTAAGIGGYGIRTSGGVPSFTAADAAHALAGAPPLGARLLLIKFGCGGEGDIRRLAIELAMEVKSLTDAPTKPQVAGIDVMQAVVREALAPTICNDCAGRGWITEDDRTDPCELCDGTGRGRWSSSRRARECGIERTAFRRSTWVTIYEEALRELVAHELQAIDSMNQRLSERG